MGSGDSGPRRADGRPVYAAQDYRDMCAGSRGSARALVPLLQRLVEPRSVVDVGCGTGEWLAVWKGSGVDTVLGIDGPWMDPEVLAIDRTEFRAWDMEVPFDVEEEFDLALCLEVGGYLRRDRIDHFVTNLVRLAPVVVFSAPIPHQSDRLDRPTLEWPEFWADAFAARGYRCFDVLRPLVWHEETVEPWIAQNVLLFVREDELGRHPGLAAATPTSRPLALVHPAIYLDHAEKGPLDLLRNAARSVPFLVRLRAALRSRRPAAVAP